jgi:hypothetical protein
MLWFLNYLPRRFAFFVQNTISFCKIWIITLVFKKTANFFTANFRKSQKSVIITSTPGYVGWNFNCNFPLTLASYLVLVLGFDPLEFPWPCSAKTIKSEMKTFFKLKTLLNLFTYICTYVVKWSLERILRLLNLQLPALALQHVG